MTTSSPLIRVADFDVDVVRKDIKNLHLGVYPPFGRVRVAAPSGFDDEAVRLAVVARLPWIKKQRQKMHDQPRQTQREFIDGETHYVWGRPHRLRVVEAARAQVATTGDRLDLHVRSTADRDARARVLDRWYRDELAAAVEELVAKWAPRIGVRAPTHGIRRMKTKWGTCKPERSHIWLNLELAHKPRECLEFIVVHELIHLIERKHTDRFFTLMSKYMPAWQQHREVLNRSPLGHQTWGPEAAGMAHPTQPPRSLVNG